MTSGPDAGADPDGKLRIALFGASGRMGRAITDVVAQQADAQLTGVCVGRDSQALGKRLVEVHAVAADRPESHLVFVDDPLAALTEADVAIDFSLPAATPTYAAACAEVECPLVCGVTGLDELAERALNRAAAQIPVLYGRNMSLGIHLLASLVAEAAKRLPAEGFDVEIHEFHHRHKRDAPSGTALLLGEAVARAREASLEELRAPADRQGQRDAGAIGFSVRRGGDVAGEHTVTFAGTGERLELAHKADRSAFAVGALSAARWVAGGRAPGRYSMGHVLEHLKR